MTPMYVNLLHQSFKSMLINPISLGPCLGYIRLQASTECEGIKLCASTGCVEPLPGHWVQCCTDGGHEQWWIEKNSLCRRQWRNTSMWTSAAYFYQAFLWFYQGLHIFILLSLKFILLHCISDKSIYCHSQSSPLPSHFVAFVGEEGHLVTARADSTVVKVWPPPPQDSRIITSPEAHIPLTGQIQG